MAVKSQARTSFRDLLSPKGKTESGILDVVFVHGLKNARTKTLKVRLKTWLSQLETRVSGTNRPSMRISIFGFDSFELVKNCRSKLPVYSDALLQDLGKRSRQQNVVFIAHGIAGWVVKHAFSSYKSAQGYLSPGVMFLGLPQFEGVGEWTQFLDHFSGNNISKGPKLDFPRFGAKSTKDPTSSDYDREQDFLFLQSICQDFDIIQDSGYGPAVFTATAEDMDVVPFSAFRKTTLQRRRTDLTIRPAKELESEDLAKMSFRDISLGSKIDKNVISFLEKQSIKVELPVSPTNDNPSQLPGSSSLTSSAQPKGPLTGFPAMTTGSLSPLAENPPQIDETSQAARKPTLHIPLFRENGSLDLTRDTPGRSQQVQPIELSSPPASPHLSISSEGNPRPRKLGRRPYENEKQELADDYYQSGELQKAKVLYQETLSITKRESYTQVFHKKRIETSLTCRIAEICVLQGHYDEAFNEFTELEKQARIEHPEQREQALEIMRWLGITLDRQGKYSEANDKLAEVEKLLVEATSDQHEDLEKRSPDSTTAFMATKMALSMVAAHKGNFMNAISASNEAEVLAKEEKNDKKLGTIIFNKAAICAYHGYYAEADTHSQEALENMQRNLGPKHVKTLDCLGLRVALLLVEGSIGSLDKAENLCRRTLIRMRREIGAEHPLTLQTLETQAKIYKAQGRLTDALDVAKYVCDKNRAHRGIGPRHPQMLGSMSTLATIYSARGQLNMALSQQEEVVRMAIAEESPLGKHHVTTLQLLSEQASIHAVRGEWELSKNLALEVFNQQCRKFVGDRYGEKYIQQIPVIDPLDYQSLLTVGKRLGLTEIPTIEFESDFSLPLLSVLNCIGVLERELGNIERSRQILQKVLDDRSRRTKRFTQNHRDTLESKFELAKTIRQLGDLPGAESEFAMIVKERSINLGADHPDTLCAAHELSMTRFQIGHTEDSARELEIIFHARFDLLGQNHPDTIKSQVSLAEVNYALGDFQAIESAKEYQLSALESQIQTSELRELDQFSGIKKQLYEDAIDRCHFPNSVKSNTWAVEDERLPKYHRQNGSGMLEPPYCPDIISGMTNLASIYAYYRHYGDTEMLEKAVQLQRAVYVLQKEYPDHHISILQTMNDLALMHQSLGDIVEAIHLFKNIGRTIEPCDPLHFTSKSNLASLYFSEKDLKEAEKLQTEVLDQWLACKANDQDPRGTVMYQFNLALTKSELGKRDPRKKKEAIELLEKALGLSTSCSINEKEIKRLLEILGSRPHERNGKANGGQ